MDLKSIDEIAWRFISALYDLDWDALIADKDNKFFRQLVLAQFTSKIYKIKKPLKDNKSINKPASFVKLLPLVLVKIQKEVNKISKYLKKNNKILEKKDTGKLYVQVFVLLTSEILKIKKTFSKLQVGKINNIYKIINNSGKLKPKLNITMKSPSRKQIIIPMSTKNRNKFIESLSSYISNLNRVLKNIKSNIIANFVRSDQSSIIIVTNKITASLDLQTIEKYIK